jgi:hypothetical protein
MKSLQTTFDITVISPECASQDCDACLQIANISVSQWQPITTARVYYFYI